MPVTTNIMPVDTVAALPAGDAFSSGTLLMPAGPVTAAARDAAAWSASPVNWLLVSLATVVVILSLRQIVGVFPYLAGGIFRWKPLVNLEDSMRLMRDRNTAALAMIAPFCFMVSRYGLYEPELVSGLSYGGKTLVAFVAFGLFVLLRTAAKAVFRSGKVNQDWYVLSFRSAYDFFILTTLAMLAVTGIASMAGLNDLTVKSILLYAIIAFFLLFLVRRTQILRNGCSQFAAILYLCALELLPASIVIVPAAIL